MSVETFTAHALLTALHGMCFGGFFLLASFGLWVGIAVGARNPVAVHVLTKLSLRAERAYLLATGILAWLAVLSGTFLIYPWYRASAPAHTTDLHAFPRQQLLANAATAPWHTIGMEWKEHVAFLAPIGMTAAAFLCWRYRDLVIADRRVRFGVLSFVAVSVGATGIAAVVGAFLDKLVPVL